MIAADFLCWAEGAAPPLTRASCRRMGRSHRKSRSRSSPVRIGTPSPEGRARSPSASPPRLPPGAARDPRHRAALAALDHRHQLVKQRAGMSWNSAYFALRPPAAPLRLGRARAGAPPPMAPVGPAARCIPPPPPPLLLRSAEKALSVPIQDQNTHQGGGGKCRRYVRRLLVELLAALPLAASRATPPAAPLDAPSTAASSYATDKRSLNITVAAGPPPRAGRARLAGPRTRARSPAHEEPPAPPAADCRSVAVQALATKKSMDDEGLFYFDESQKEGWVGGVRALRDSHVRLVLRQLRHIERLNRALDRARPLPPAAPSVATHATATAATAATAARYTARLQKRTPHPL